MNNSRGYDSFLRVEPVSEEESPKMRVQPQDNIEKKIINLRKQQDILQSKLEECIYQAEMMSKKGEVERDDFTEYRVEQMLMQIADQLSGLEKSIPVNMDKVGENIFNNLSKSSESIEDSCLAIEKGILGINNSFIERSNAQNKSMEDLKESIEKELKSQTEIETKILEKQKNIAGIESKMPILVGFSIVNILGIILNIILNFLK